MHPWACLYRKKRRQMPPNQFFQSYTLAKSGGISAHVLLCLYIQLCRFLKRQDRPTALPRHKEYASLSAANRRRDTDRWRRQVTRLPKPFPQYPPLTLRYGMMRLLRCALGAASTSQQLWSSARTFDVIVLTGLGCGLTSFGASQTRRQSLRPGLYRGRVLLAY